MIIEEYKYSLKVKNINFINYCENNYYKIIKRTLYKNEYNRKNYLKYL